MYRMLSTIFMRHFLKLYLLIIIIEPCTSPAFGNAQSLNVLLDSAVAINTSAQNIIYTIEEANYVLQQAKSEKKLEHFKISIDKYNQVLTFYIKVNDVKNILECYSGLADCYKKTEDRKKCNEYALLQYNLAEANNEFKSLAGSCLTLSWTHADNHGKSIEYLIKAKEYAEKVNDLVLTTKVNLSFAGQYMEQGKYDMSIELLNDAIPIAEQSGDTSLIFSAYNILGITYRRTGKYIQCGEVLEKAALISKASGNTVNEAMAENNLIRLYKYNLQDTAKMFLHYYRAKALAKTSNNLNLESRIDSYIAQYYFETNDYDKCILLSNEIMNRSAKFKDYSMTSSMNDLLYQVYEKKEDYKQALEYHVQFKADFDSLSNVERSNKAKELLTKYETEKKEKELALLNQEKAERELKYVSQQNELSQSILINKQQTQELEISNLTLNKTNSDLEKKKLEIDNATNQLKMQEQEKLLQAAVISRQKNQQLIIIGFGLTLLLIGFLLFHRFKLMKKLEAQQALLNERKRISSELHDDLGAQLSTAKMLLNNIQKNGGEGNNKEIISSSLSIIDSSIKDLRVIMDDLQASTLQDKGLIYATEELVNKINKLQRIDFTLSHHGLDKRLNPKHEHHLFRITQELVNNTLKYAKAKSVMISLVNHGDKIIFMYEDDGNGFDLKNVKRGYGLSNIESRSSSMGGVMEFESNPGNGFHALIEIPMYAESKI